MSRPVINVLRLPRVSPMVMLHLEEILLRYDPANRNFLLLNRPLPQHRAVILGISGKPELLVNQEQTTKDSIPLVKRYTGGGTVFVNETVRFAGFVMNKDDLPTIKPFPHDIMKWTELVYNGTINRMCNKTEELFQGQERNIDFSLRENDYVFGDLKFGGNAQSIIRTRWVHHTSFLWDLDVENISRYLTLPQKRPEYRQSRSHRDFLVEMRPLFDPTHTTGSFEVDADVDVDNESMGLTGGCLYTHEYTQHVHQNGDINTKPDLLTHMQRLQRAYMVNKWLNAQSGNKGNSLLLEDSIVEQLGSLFRVQEVSIDDVKDALDNAKEQTLGTKLI